MSDSEDTDSLLSIATPTGLTNFLGLTVEQMSTHINSLTNQQSEETKSSSEERKVDNGSREAVLNQLQEWSDSDNDANDDAKSDSGSEASTASTNSITLLMASEGKEDPNKDIEVIDTATADPAPDYIHYEEDFPDISNGIPETSNKMLEFKYDKYKAPNYGVRISPGFGAQGVNFLRPSPNSGWRYLPGWEQDPQLVQRAPNFRTPGGYKPPENQPPPRDLTDAQIQEETRQMYAEGNDDEDETNGNSFKFTTKVNKEAEASVESKETQSGLQGEGDGAGVKINIEDQIIPNPSSENSEVESKSTNKGDEDSAASGKCARQKLLSAGENPGSIPDLGFGLRDFDKLEVKETPVVPSHSWVCGSSSGGSGQEKKKKNRRDRPNVSFVQFRDENNLEISPIKAAYLEKNGMSADISRCLPRYRPSTNKTNVIKSPTKKVNLLELDLLWRDIRTTKERMEEDIEKSSARLKALSIDPLNVEPHLPHESTGQQPSTPKQFVSQAIASPRGLFTQETETPPSTFSQISKEKKKSKSILKSKTKSSDLSKATDVSFDFSGATDDLPSIMSGVDSTLLPTDLDTLELSSILSAANIKSSEFQDILERIEDFSDETFEDIGEADEEIETILTKLEVSDWAKSGANEYMQKFHEEKFKRNHCEQEIAALQKTVLKLQEESVVREKMANKKDLILIKMSKAWSEVTKQWKAHELQSKEILDKLQKNQRILTESLTQSKQRIEDYEKELASAVDLAANFKSKLESLEVLRSEEVSKLSNENDGLKDKFTGLEHTLDSIKVEKDAAVRALSESQKQLDDRVLIHDEMQDKLSLLEMESHEREQDLQKISEQKQVLEDHLQSVAVQKDALENQVVDLCEQLKVETEEKERLKLNQHLEIERNLKEESDRLHNYYNQKLQEVIQLQSQKMVAAETQLLENHQRQLGSLEKDMMRKIRECKNRCLSETNKMKSRYENEIKILRDDLTQKQHFISRISNQLQTYVQSDRNQDTEQVRIGQIFSEGSNQCLTANRKNPSDLSLASSTDSTVDSNTEFKKHSKSRLKKSDCNKVMTDECNSSVEDFQPSKLSRYNTSTPNSVLEPHIASIKGWRELPNIQHLLHPDNEQPVSTYVLTESTKLHKLFPPVRSLLNDNSYLDSPTKLDREFPLTEHGLQRCIQTLAKVYSEQMLAGHSNQISSQNPQHNLIGKESPLLSAMKKDKENSSLLMNVDSCGKQSQMVDPNRQCSGVTESVTLKQMKPLKPPWK